MQNVFVRRSPLLAACLGSIFGSILGVVPHALAHDNPKKIETLIDSAKEPIVHRAVYRPAAGSTGPVVRGPGCPIIPVTRFRAPRPGVTTDLDFDNIQPGQQIVLQQGFIQGEIQAVSFQIPDEAFPIKMEEIQTILGSVSTQSTTTRYAILLWDGEPTGQPLYEAVSDSANPAAPADLVLPGGPGGINAVIGDLRFLVDNGGDINNDWTIPAFGTPGVMHTVSIGMRIVQHNFQSGTGCEPGSVPGNFNAFPSTEPATCCTPPSLLTFPNDNWLFAVFCEGGCGQGWRKFSQLAANFCFLGQCLGCRPSGDWAMRLKYSSVVCLPPPTGACCAASGSCTSNITQANCSGTWQEAVACSPNPCPQPMGACCTTGSCTLTTPGTCPGGTFQGIGTICDGTPCPQPTGACCFTPTSCQVIDSATCTGFGGTYIGNNIACGQADTCPLGACCLPSGSCVAGLSQPQCSAQGGTFQGIGSTCGSVNCPQPTGACCNNASGFCGTLTQAACANIPNTSWRGPLTLCTPNPCSLTGACCTGTTCTVTNSAGCSGTFQGNSTACGAAGNPTTCCKANFNIMGGVTVQDIFDFLGAYFANDPSADFNGAGGITVQDIFDFLGAYFTGCSG